MDGTKKPWRKRGEHLLPGAVKTEIIKYVLSKNGEVTGPDIRTYLRENQEIRIKTNKNVWKHLEKLGPEYHCLEKIPFEREGFENKWDIKTRGNLQKIQKHYEHIQLENYPKTFTILFQESGQDLFSFKGIFIYILLVLSPSFFNKCIEIGFEKLYSLFLKIYQTREGHRRNQYINNTIDICYDLYKKSCPNVKVTKKEFRKKIEKISNLRYGIFENSYILRLFKENFPDVSEEKLEKIIEENSKNWELEIPAEISPKINEKYLEKCIYDLARTMEQELAEFEIEANKLISDYFLEQDIIDEVNSDNIELAENLRDALIRLYSYTNNKETGQPKDEFLRLASEVVFKYQQPLFFGKTYNDSHDAYQKLKNNLNKAYTVSPVYFKNLG